MDERAATFLSSLGRPRFSTVDHDPAQPIILIGVLDGKDTEFFASPTDVMPYGRELHRRAAAGELGEIGPFAPPEDLFAPSSETP
jgi:hypothetical protein